MNREELVKALRENAEWCDGEEWNIPICMGDNQREAADLLENAEIEKQALRNAANGFRDRAEMAEAERDSRYTAHEVAVILAEVIGDDCACNVNGNDEWLPEKCELLDVCPDTVGVACWEQYLKWRAEETT